MSSALQWTFLAATLAPGLAKRAAKKAVTAAVPVPAVLTPSMLLYAAGSAVVGVVVLVAAFRGGPASAVGVAIVSAGATLLLRAHRSGAAVACSTFLAPPLADACSALGAHGTALVWPFSAVSAPFWGAFIGTTFAFWFCKFVLGKGTEASVREGEARKKDKIEAMMGAVLAYAAAEAAKPEGERGEVEAARLLGLLYDDTHEKKALEYGVDRELVARVKALFLEVAAAELRRAVEKTRKARDKLQKAGDESIDKEDGEYESGEKLHEAIEFASDAVRKLGRAAVDGALLRDARALEARVFTEQSKKYGDLVTLVRPVVPMILWGVFVTCLLSALRSKFHQIGAW